MSSVDAATAPANRVPAGGLPIDVDPRSGRLLSVAELHRALQTARQDQVIVAAAQPAAPTTTRELLGGERGPAPVTAPESRPLAPLDLAPAPQGSAVRVAPPAAASPPSGLSGAAAITSPQVVLRAEADPDPFAWDEEPADEIRPPGPETPTERVEPASSAVSRRRGGAVGALRAVVGLDREPVRTSEKRKRRSGAGKDRAPEWVEGLAQTSPGSPAAAPTGPGMVRPEGAVSGRGRPARRRLRRSGSQPLPVRVDADVALGPRTKASRRSGASDIEVMRAPRGFSAALGRTALLVILAAVALAGVKQVLVNPFLGHSAAAAPAAETFDKQGASAAATRYATDYLSFSPASSAAGAAAVSADAAPASDAGGSRWWKGSGYLRADTALPGAVRVVDSTHALVTVSVRVHVAMPPKKAPAQGPAVPAPVGPAGSAGDPGTVPAGWSDLGARWLVLTVPVVVNNSGAAVVTGGGAVFTAEAPQLVAAPDGAQDDTTLGRDTQATATTLFSSYARSDVGYVTAPGATIRGLAGAVTLVGLPDWSTSVPKPAAGSTAAATSATGSGTVTWQLAGTDLQISQPYALAMVFNENRWYIDRIGPQLSTTPGL